MKSFLLLSLSCIWFVVTSDPLSAATPLVNHSDTWHYRKGTNAPPADWNTAADASLDAIWNTGPGGFGYADNDDVTQLNDMRNSYLTVYIRKSFTISQAVDPSQHLQLLVNWDDGYVAYLDGVEISRSPNVPGAPGTIHPHNQDLNNDGREAGTTVLLDVGAVGNRLPVGPHILAVQGINDDIGSSDLSLIVDLQLGDADPGTINEDTVWTLAQSPYLVTNDLTVSAGVTLTIEPGVRVLFNQGRNIIVRGRLLAEGNAAERISFARNTGATSWGTLEFESSPVTNRLMFADVDGSTGNIDALGTTLYLQNLKFTNTTAQVIDLVNSSVILLDTFIPGNSSVEPVHFNDMPANGHALIQNCVFAAPAGYNDSIDFTGGNRPGPIARFINNVFLASVDDCFDMDGTDAHIEGNIFMNVRKDGNRDSSSNPITTGADGANRSELVICRNIFYNGEHAFMEKDFGQALLQNNTILRITANPLSMNPGEAPGIIMFGEPWRGFPFGNGAIFEGNIASDLQVTDPWPQLAGAQAANPGFFFLRNFNCVQGFPQPGSGNISTDPMFVGTSSLTAENIRQMLALQVGSPCIGTGPNGIDMGAIVPSGASISGAPLGTTTDTSATLSVAGPGIWSYRWRLNGGTWSEEISLVPAATWAGQPFTAGMLSNAPPILLTNLAPGDYTVEVVGRDSAGAWQDTNSAAAASWSVSGGSSITITHFELTGGNFLFQFPTKANMTYSILFRPSLTTGSWEKLVDVAAAPQDDIYTFTDSTIGLARGYYQVVSPARP